MFHLCLSPWRGCERAPWEQDRVPQGSLFNPFIQWVSLGNEWVGVQEFWCSVVIRINNEWSFPFPPSWITKKFLLIFPSWIFSSGGDPTSLFSRWEIWGSEGLTHLSGGHQSRLISCSPGSSVFGIFDHRSHHAKTTRGKIRGKQESGAGWGGFRRDQRKFLNHTCIRLILMNLTLNNLKLRDAVSLQVKVKEHVIHFKYLQWHLSGLDCAWFYHRLPSCLTKCRAHPISIFVEWLTRMPTMSPELYAVSI